MAPRSTSSDAKRTKEMKKAVKFLSVCVVATAFFCSLISADELVFPAAQIEQGKGMVSFYLNRSDENLSLKITNREEIRIGGNSYFSDVSNDLEAEGRGEAAIVKVIVNPWSGFYYWLKAGSGSYELEIPSVTVRNRLSGMNHGVIAGMGIRSLLFPETIVTPALALDFGVNYRKYDFNTLQPEGGQKSVIQNTFEITDLQAAVLISRKSKGIEPYGGVKVSRSYVTLSDVPSLGKISGSKDTAGVVIGTHLYPFPHESLFIEGVFSEKTSYSVGWKIDF